MRRATRNIGAVLLAGAMVLSAAACGSSKSEINENLAVNEEENQKMVNLFGPMEKSDPDGDNVARTAHEQTVRMAEKELGVYMEYRT